MLFPMNPPRALHITSPPMHGKDVKDLQKALNLWSKTRGLHHIAVDGKYGQATAHQLGVVGYSMGLGSWDASKNTIRLVYHPWLRNPVQRRRAAQRAKLKKGLSGVVAQARTHIGVHENPAGSNRGNPHPSDWQQRFGMNGVPWCGCFAGSMVMDAGGHVTSRVAFTPFIEQDARSGSGGFERWANKGTKGPGPGWLVLYNWVGGSTPEHVGIVESFDSQGVTAIEGNTSGANPSDGGEVARMHRPYQFVLGYAKPRL